MTTTTARCVRCEATGALGEPCPEHPELRLVAPESLARYPEAHLLGRLISGRYAVVDVVGVGGMGWVYEALQEPIGRRVAIKVLKLDRAEDPTLRERFLREARILGMLKHPNLVGLHDFGEVDRPEQLFMALEFVEGVQLGTVIRRREPMGPERLLRILMGIASGLAEIHHHDVVHRDIKPENIILVRDHEGLETARLLDFGIARFDPHRAHLTQTGTTFGTPEYMSPEQAKGLATIDPATDIYAVGVLTYQLLSGRLPFSNRSMLKVMLAQVHDAPPPLCIRDGVVAPEPLVALMHRCLDKSPEARPADGDALIAELRAIRDALAAGDATLMEGDDARFAPEPGNTHVTVPTLPSAPPTPLGLSAAEDHPAPVEAEPTAGHLPSNVQREEPTVGELPSARHDDDAAPIDDEPTLAGHATLQVHALPDAHATPAPIDDEPTLTDVDDAPTERDLVNDLEGDPPLDTTELRDARSRRVVLTIVILLALLASVFGVLALATGEEDAAPSEREELETTPATGITPDVSPPALDVTGPPKPQGLNAPPAGVLAQLAQLNALQVALTNDAQVLPAERAARAEEIQQDIDTLRARLEAAGYDTELVDDRYRLTPTE